MVRCRDVASPHLPAHKVCKADDKTRGENGVSRPQRIAAVSAVNHAHMLQLCLKDDGHDDTVDGHSFTEDDAAQEMGGGMRWRTMEASLWSVSQKRGREKQVPKGRFYLNQACPDYAWKALTKGERGRERMGLLHAHVHVQ